jgi:hemerythrin
MIPWKPSSAVGVTEIDVQHQVLFEHAARFEAAVTAGEPDERLAELFGFLAQHAELHLQAEEHLLRETRHPDLEEHLRQHADFRRRLQSLEPPWNSEGGSPGLLLASVESLDHWLRDHNTSSDQLLGDHLRARAGLPSLRQTR